MHTRLASLAFASMLAVPMAANAQQFVMMPDSTNNRLVLLSPVDGSVVNDNYFPLSGGTTIHALQVGDEIWISEQLGDRVSRWSLTGTPLGQIGGQFPGGGLDNIRGMALINDTLYVSNAGTQNDAPGPSVVMFDINGNPMGFIPTAGLAPSPFAVLEFNGNMLVASSSANDDVHQFTLTGSSLGTFHNSTSVNFAQQMAIADNGDVLVAAFSSNNVARLNPADGSLISDFPASNARGVYQLQNGNIMWSNGTGVFVYDVVNQTSSQVYAGGARHFGDLDLGAGPGECLGDIADDFGFTVNDGGGPDGVVDFGDFVALLGLIGPCDGGVPGCLGDIADDFGFTVNDGGGPDGVVDFGDFVALLGLIGPCP